MRNYEIVIIFNPNSINNIQNLINKYKNNIESNFGKLNKLEDIGIRNLSYPIKKLNKAYYILLNISCSIDFIKKFNNEVKMNETIIRYIIIKTKFPIIKYSKLFENKLLIN